MTPEELERLRGHVERNGAHIEALTALIEDQQGFIELLLTRVKALEGEYEEPVAGPRGMSC